MGNLGWLSFVGLGFGRFDSGCEMIGGFLCGSCEWACLEGAWRLGSEIFWGVFCGVFLDVSTRNLEVVSQKLSYGRRGIGLSGEVVAVVMEV